VNTTKTWYSRGKHGVTPILPPIYPKGLSGVDSLAGNEREGGGGNGNMASPQARK